MVTDQKNAPAFTLVELIVVMAIVAVLVGLSVLGIATVQRSSRDTQRISTLEAINLEIEAYNGNNGSYPAAITLNAGSNQFTIGTQTVNLSGSAVADVASTNGIGGTGTSQLRTDYCYENYGSAYSLRAQLESGSIQSFGTGTACSVTAAVL